MLKMPNLGTVTLKKFTVLFLLFIATAGAAAVVPVEIIPDTPASVFTHAWLEIWLFSAAGAAGAAGTKMEIVEAKFYFPFATKFFIGLIFGVATIAGAIAWQGKPFGAPSYVHIPFAVLAAAIGGLLFVLTVGFLEDQKRFNKYMARGISKTPFGRGVVDAADFDEMKQEVDDEHNRTN